jgi:symplekin
MGGQVKIDVNLLTDMMLGGHGDGSPSSQIVSILKPAALAFLEIESSVQQEDDTDPEFKIDRSNFDMDFTLNQKSFTVAVNAVSMLAINRPVFYKEAATCLARRAYDPPVFTDGGSLTNSAVLAIAAQLRASCLTLLRNTLSVITNRWEILQKALIKYDMGVQADKAVAAARQAAALKTAGRAARNRAAMFYEWDDSEGDKRVSKRQRETDDALAKMRAAKASRGLGHGIKLPTSMIDAVELIVLNLPHLPSSRPPVGKSAKARKTPITLDFVIDAVMSNGASLSQEDGQWYDRDGGAAWSIDMMDEPHYALESTIMAAAEVEHDESKAMELDEKSKGLPKLFNGQCHAAASDAFGRIVTNSSRARTAYQKEFANKIAARLAWTLKGVPPPKNLLSSIELAEGSTKSLSKQIDAVNGASNAVKDFVTSYPLVSSCLTLDVTASTNPTSTANAITPSSMSSFVLNEAYMHDCFLDERQEEKHNAVYDRSLDVYAASVTHASQRANEKPSDLERKRVASLAAATLPQHLGVLPSVTPSSLALISALCDIEEITKKDAEASRKSSQQTIAASAAVHAAKVAAEKRATAALLALRDTAFQRSKHESRKSAVDCAVAVAAGRYPSTPSVEDKALKLVMNVLFPRSEALSNTVVESASGELERAADFAVANYEAIQRANKDTPIKADPQKKHGSIAGSEEEKKALEHVRKPAMLFMALCVRRPELIKTLMTLSCKKKADVLLRTVQANMPKLARAAATKHGAATVALKVSEMAIDDEVPVLLAFLDNLVPVGDKNLPPQDLIDACFAIQESRLCPDGKKDARFIIPVLTGMKRADLIDQLPGFVAADNKIFLAALEKMGSRVARQALLFRDEPDPENPFLHGMTLCEQLVFLHQMDFSTVHLPQKRYLDAIRLCLEDDEVFTDRVVMVALDYISGRFLTTEEKLPLAYMRTIILTCSKHESLHSWICHVLLPRLIEGKVYTDRRQWEGWMRCAKMLENTGDSGVSSLETISKLPAEQLEMYRAKYPQ